MNMKNSQRQKEFKNTETDFTKDLLNLFLILIKLSVIVE